MPIQSVKDINDAFAAGRFHTQRFLKNAGGVGDGRWRDWSYVGGQPVYDGRIGNSATLTPFIASRNDAIYFPSIAADQNRHLTGLRVYVVSGGANQQTVSFEMYDLLAVYPLLDGDSTDLQVMDNTASLPRYSDGVGVRAVLVNHISPALIAGSLCTISYTDADDVARSLICYTTLDGAETAAWTLVPAGTSAGGMLYLPTVGRGVKKIDSLQFSSAPGGLWVVYLLRPIARVDWHGGVNVTTPATVMAEKCFCATESFNLPRIHDGANLGFFYMANGGSRSVTLFGTSSFIWG